MTTPAQQSPPNQWIEVETVHHAGGSGSGVKIMIVQNQLSRLYTAVVSGKEGKRWVVNKQLELTMRENWSDVLDEVVAKVSNNSEQRHHTTKLWEVRK